MEYGHTKLFQNPDQEALHDAIKRAGNATVATFMKDPKVRKMLTVRGGDNSESAKKVRLRGRIRVLSRRLKSRGHMIAL